MGYFIDYLHQPIWGKHLDCMISIESDVDFTVSAEGLSLKSVWEKIVELFNKIKNFFISVFKKIKSWLSVLFKGNKARKTIEVSTLVKEMDIYTDEDIRKAIISFFNQHTKNHIGLMFDSGGKLTDFNKLISEIEKHYTTDVKGILDMIKSGELTTSINYDVFTNSNKFLAGINGYKDANDVLKNLSVFNKINKTSLFQYLSKIEEYTSKAAAFYEKYNNKLNGDIKRLETYLKSSRQSGNSEPTSEAKAKVKSFNNTLHVYYNFLRIANMPSAFILSYIRLIATINKSLSDVEYTTTKDLKPKHLYHVSNNPSLKGFIRTLAFLPGRLRPRIPKSGPMELLPPRISFAEDPLQCCLGTPHNFITPDKEFDDDNKAYKDLYLYEGIPDKDTLYLKPELVNYFVLEPHYSKEFTVVSDIGIKKLGKIRVWYRTDKDKYDHTRFIRVEYL